MNAHILASILSSIYNPPGLGAVAARAAGGAAQWHGGRAVLALAGGEDTLEVDVNIRTAFNCVSKL